MAPNFITNNTTHKTLKGRLNTLISISDELKFLVGFFYFPIFSRNNSSALNCQLNEIVWFAR